MKFLIALIVVFCCEWYAYFRLDPDSVWIFTLCSQQLTIAICLSMALSFAHDVDLRARSVLAFLCCTAWIDVQLNIMWAIYGLECTGLAPVAAFLLVWALWVMSRTYDIQSSEINHNNVMVLMLKPTSFTMIIKSFFGLPVSSVCILADGKVWSYRTKAGVFCKASYTDRWLKTHICRNTGVQTTPEILRLLDNTVGTHRGIGIKCIYSIRKVLSELGHEFKPKTFLHFIPGVYATQLLGARDD